jgi:hypothetical protein
MQLLSLVMPVLHRLEWCCTAIGSGGANNLLEPRVSECLQFLRSETAGKLKDYSLFGVITTQTVSHQHCTLDMDSKSLPLKSFIHFIRSIILNLKFDMKIMKDTGIKLLVDECVRSG